MGALKWEESFWPYIKNNTRSTHKNGRNESLKVQMHNYGCNKEINWKDRQWQSVSAALHTLRDSLHSPAVIDELMRNIYADIYI